MVTMVIIHCCYGYYTLTIVVMVTMVTNNIFSASPPVPVSVQPDYETGVLQHCAEPVCSTCSQC